MDAPRTPLPKVGYQRDHEGSWTLYRDGMRIGRIDRDLETQALSVMVDNLYWSLDGTKLQTHGGLAVKPMHKRRQLQIICLEVAYALRELEMGGEVQPATIAPRAKPTITIDLEPVSGHPKEVNGVGLDTTESGNVLLSIGTDALGMSPYQARAAWVLLGEYLCEPAGPGLDRRATPTPDGGVMRNGAISYPSPAMKARRAVCDGLETMWRMSFSTDPTEADLNGMARILKEMAS